MGTFISKSPEDTLALGARWGAEAGTGWVFALDGDLGAGKTQLVKGVAAGLGIVARVHSPTFSLLNCYEGGRLPLFHLDLYRLESREQVIAAGLEEFVCRPEGVAVIEWAARWFGDPPVASMTRTERGPPCRLVKIETLDPLTRRISDEDFGL
jgi:tRNA threonylcarbamoyladenosine biosynthesis protein TsaE